MVITNVTPGLHTTVVWHREDGLCLDKTCIEAGVRSAREGKIATKIPGHCYRLC